MSHGHGHRGPPSTHSSGLVVAGGVGIHTVFLFASFLDLSSFRCTFAYDSTLKKTFAVLHELAWQSERFLKRILPSPLGGFFSFVK